MDPARPCSAPAPPWVVLNRFPRRNSVAQGVEGAGISLGLEAPPGITQLNVTPSMTAAGHVLAADPSGILLFRDSYGSAEEPLAIDRRHSNSSFLLWDAEFKSSYVLPIVPRDDFGIDDAIGTAGLVVVPGDFGRSDMMVAELAVSSTVDCDNGAVLRCFLVPATSTDKWISKILRSPPTKFPWQSAHALSYKGRLWWVDPLQGLLACNPFADKPKLHFVRLPSCFSPGVSQGDEQSLRKGLNNDRRVNVSCGMLRLAVLTRCKTSPKIKLWTLANPETGKWILNDEVPLEQIWDDESYLTTRLPWKRPEIVLIHPSKSHVVYFCLEQHLFSVDLQTRMVIQSANCSSNWPYNLLAWELPPYLRATSSDSSSGGESAFDRITNSFCSAYARELASMEFQQMAALALGTLNKNKRNMENKYKLPEHHSVSYFYEFNPEKRKKYAHMNFYAHNGSGKVLIFAELQTISLDDNDDDNWTVSSCKILNKNCHGGLCCDDADLVRSKKRKKSLYCFACEPEVLHPMSGFEGGYGTGCQ